MTYEFCKECGKNGITFENLKKDVFDTKLIYIYTMDGIYIFKPFSIYQTTSDVYYFKTDFEDDSEIALHGDFSSRRVK